MKYLLIFILITTFGCQSQRQNNELEYRSVEYYFEKIAALEIAQLLEQNVMLDSNTIADQYFDEKTNTFSKEGSMKYMEIKMDVYKSFFQDYLYQQHIDFDNYVYVLYFTVAGYDDLEWIIVKWNQEEWKNEEKLSRKTLKSDKSLTKLFWNYDEGPKNIENVKLSIENEYLIFERGNLFHSLYDLKTDALILNEESPWNASKGKDKEEMNKWIKTKLHEKIEQKVNKKRE